MVRADHAIISNPAFTQRSTAVDAGIGENVGIAIFIAEGDGFTAEPVTLGRGDRTSVEVTRGLKAGQRYVLKGAFELKAKIATSGMDAHAGHGL